MSVCSSSLVTCEEVANQSDRVGFTRIKWFVKKPGSAQ